jgi:hypothetical protein
MIFIVVLQRYTDLLPGDGGRDISWLAGSKDAESTDAFRYDAGEDPSHADTQVSKEPQRELFRPWMKEASSMFISFRRQIAL